MSAVGSLVFCTDCGNLLESSTGNKNSILAHFADCGRLCRYCLEDYHNNNEACIVSFSVETKEIHVANRGEE
ncbi:DNA-directed RNA polymerase I core subunit rpa12 [Clarireedia jacksonii]